MNFFGSDSSSASTPASNGSSSNGLSLDGLASPNLASRLVSNVAGSAVSLVASGLSEPSFSL
jgi:hypothetical protein